MSSRALVLLLISIQLVQSELLFEQGFIKFVRHGKRQTFNNVEYIDENLIGNDKQLVIVKAKWIETLHPEAVRNLVTLKLLFLAKCGIHTVEPKAFFNLPNLTVLHLEDNAIKEVKRGVLNGLPIKNLTLHRNGIKHIDSGAFDNMPNLYRVKLNGNKLKSWDSEWFKNCPKITELYFRRNRINYLPPNAFKNIKGRHLIEGAMVTDTKIFLSKNKLGMINPESFNSLEVISQLYLDRNNISEVPDGAFRNLKNIDVLFLARNKIGNISKSALPKIEKIAILDLSNNLLECVDYELVVLASVTNLERNNVTCDCGEKLKKRFKEEKRNNEITYYEDECAEEGRRVE